VIRRPTQANASSTKEEGTADTRGAHDSEENSLADGRRIADAADETETADQPSVIFALHGGKDTALGQLLAEELRGTGLQLALLNAASVSAGAAGAGERRAARSAVLLLVLLTPAFLKHKGCRLLLEEAVASGASWLPLLEGSGDLDEFARELPWLADALTVNSGRSVTASAAEASPPSEGPFVLDVCRRGSAGNIDRERLYERLAALLQRLLCYPLGLSLRDRMDAGASPLAPAKAAVVHGAQGADSPAVYQECVQQVGAEDRETCRRGLGAALALAFHPHGQTQLLQAGLFSALGVVFNKHAQNYPDIALLAATAVNHAIFANPLAQGEALRSRILPAVLRLMSQHSSDPAVLQQVCLILQRLTVFTCDAASSQAQMLVVQAMQNHLLASPELAEECAITLLAMATAQGMTKTQRATAWRAHLQASIKETQARLLPATSTMQELLRAITKAYKG
jgi:hypothetical protein